MIIIYSEAEDPLTLLSIHLELIYVISYIYYYTCLHFLQQQYEEVF